jgi:predicted dehydrogenase
MRQIISNFKTGMTVLDEVPAPSLERGHLLIATRRTLVSQGTEKMLVQFGKASLFQKARSQPAKVRQVLSKIRADGLIPTVESVFRKLDEPLPLGYCNAGSVIGVGEGVEGFAVGDRVASNGPHAEIVSVPQNLTAKIPENVSDDAAAFTVLGAIGLQGIRLGKPELGETFVVVGLGLIGQVTAQLLQAHGCRVIGFDFDPDKVKVAKSFGISAVTAGGEIDVVKHVQAATGGAGCDAVIITASTSSHDVIAQAAHMSRKRGRIVLVGVVGLNINRADFYEKELSFQVSCSYGPGRYETAYEDKGLDYPLGLVRWTENRNFQAVLEAMARGALKVESLISRRVPLLNFGEIYDNMDAGGLASLLVYEGAVAAPFRADADMGRVKVFASGPAAGGSPTTLTLNSRQFLNGDGVLAVIGAGNFTKMTALPALATIKAPVKVIVSSGGVTGTALARKYGVPHSSTDYAAVLADHHIRGVIITTRHNLHAEQTIAAVKAGKHVLVEKPLCLNLAELREIEAAVAAANGETAAKAGGPWVSVGFNRRFSPHVIQMKSLFGSASAPVALVATMNAGAIPLNHWVHDPEVGGGRLVGEACHFVDLAIHLTGSLIVEVGAAALAGTTDSASILLRHANGSTSVVNYLTNGNSSVSKERVEIHSEGRSLLLDNFRELTGFGFRTFSTLKTKQDKGHGQQFGLFAERVKMNGPALIPWNEITNGARASLAILKAISDRGWIRVNEI